MSPTRGTFICSWTLVWKNSTNTWNVWWKSALKLPSRASTDYSHKVWWKSVLHSANNTQLVPALITPTEFGGNQCWNFAKTQTTWTSTDNSHKVWWKSVLKLCQNTNNLNKHWQLPQSLVEISAETLPKHKQLIQTLITPTKFGGNQCWNSAKTQTTFTNTDNSHNVWWKSVLKLCQNTKNLNKHWQLPQCLVEISAETLPKHKQLEQALITLTKFGGNQCWNSAKTQTTWTSTDNSHKFWCKLVLKHCQQHTTRTSTDHFHKVWWKSVLKLCQITHNLNQHWPLQQSLVEISAGTLPKHKQLEPTLITPTKFGVNQCWNSANSTQLEQALITPTSFVVNQCWNSANNTQLEPALLIHTRFGRNQCKTLPKHKLEPAHITPTKFGVNQCWTSAKTHKLESALITPTRFGGNQCWNAAKTQTTWTSTDNSHKSVV